MRIARCKVVNCKHNFDTSECTAGSEEEDIHTKTETHDNKSPVESFKLVDKVKSLAEKLNGFSKKLDGNPSKDFNTFTISTLSSQNIKSLGIEEPKANTNLRPRQIHLHLMCSLLVFSILSVSWLCHPQCCEYYQAWQVWRYRGGTIPT